MGNEGQVAAGTATPSAAPTPNKGIRSPGRPDPSGQPKARRKRKVCSEDGCTKNAQEGGVCIKHGAKVKQRKVCSEEDCTNGAQKGGVCYKHGAKVKRCSHYDCTKQVQQGGVCIEHGAKVKRCSHDGCSKFAQTGGVCVKHGAKVQQGKCVAKKAAPNLPKTEESA